MGEHPPGRQIQFHWEGAGKGASEMHALGIASLLRPPLLRVLPFS